MSLVFRSLLKGPRYLLLGLILLYRYFFSPLKNALFGPGGCCRFYPTCSDYTWHSIKTHGLIMGTVFSLRRLLKCQPFHPGGFDPVKPVKAECHTLSRPESLLDLQGK